MESKDGLSKPHVVVLAYPATGHTNPILQFSKNLASRGLLVTFVNFGFNHHIMLPAKDSLQRLRLDIRFESIADNLPQDHTLDSNINNSVFNRMHDMDGSGLEELIERLNGDGPPVSCIIHDSFLPWVRDVANKLNIPRAFFWTQSSAVFSIYHHFKHVERWDPERMPETVTIPGVGELNLADIPRQFFPPSYASGALAYYFKQLDSVADASWVLGNSFYELEPQTIDYIRTIIPFRSIGPSIPSAFLDGGNPEDREAGGNRWEAAECMQWLDAKPPFSVVYISFGSITVISAEQIHELAMGIRNSRQNFVWVIRPPPGHGHIEELLPVGFMEETRERGLVVQWCAQLEVLSHASVGAFMSHCGWNSTLDGLSSGVPILAFGVWTDQTTNSKFVADIWKTGVQMRKREDGIVRKDEIERCMKLAVESEEGVELRKNAKKWKELASRAMMQGGSSHTNLNEFVRELSQKTNA
eukprot:Gb_31207 [translate_table: standard]